MTADADAGSSSGSASGSGSGAAGQPRGSDHEGRDFQAEADAYLAQVLDGLTGEQAAVALATLANRVATRLHNLARSQAADRKGQPDWAAWAQLQNAARNVVLQASTCRDLARRLTGQRPP